MAKKKGGKRKSAKAGSVADTVDNEEQDYDEPAPFTKAAVEEPEQTKKASNDADNEDEDEDADEVGDTVTPVANSAPIADWFTGEWIISDGGLNITAGLQLKRMVLSRGAFGAETDCSLAELHYSVGDGSDGEAITKYEVETIKDVSLLTFETEDMTMTCRLQAVGSGGRMLTLTKWIDGAADMENCITMQKLVEMGKTRRSTFNANKIEEPDWLFGEWVVKDGAINLFKAVGGAGGEEGGEAEVSDIVWTLLGFSFDKDAKSQDSPCLEIDYSIEGVDRGTLSGVWGLQKDGPQSFLFTNLQSGAGALQVNAAFLLEQASPTSCSLTLLLKNKMTALYEPSKADAVKLQKIVRDMPKRSVFNMHKISEPVSLQGQWEVVPGEQVVDLLSISPLASGHVRWQLTHLELLEIIKEEGGPLQPFASVQYLIQEDPEEGEKKAAATGEEDLIKGRAEGLWGVQSEPQYSFLFVQLDTGGGALRLNVAFLFKPTASPDELQLTLLKKNEDTNLYGNTKQIVRIRRAGK